MTTLVIAEHDHAALKSATLHTIAAAQKLGGDIHVLVAGHNAGGPAQAAAGIAGVAKVLHADAAHLAGQTAENLAALVTALAAPYSHLFLPATGFGKNAGPRIAALLDVAQSSGGSGGIESVAVPADTAQVEVLGQELTKSDRPELTNARVVISGGRGLQNGENFKMLEALAAKLNPPIGASRAAVDAGYV